MARDDRDIPIPRALGRFFGHLWNAAARPVRPADRAEVSRTSEEQEAEIDGKRVLLRRTTIDEVEFRERDG